MKGPSPVQTGEPVFSKSEEVLTSDRAGPSVPESHDTTISFLTCLTTISREQQKMRNLFLIDVLHVGQLKQCILGKPSCSLGRFLFLIRIAKVWCETASSGLFYGLSLPLASA